MNESVNARIAGCKLAPSARMIFLFINEPYNKQLNNLDRLVVTGKSQTEALPYWPSDSEVNTVGRGLRFSRNDLTLGYLVVIIIIIKNFIP